MIEFWYILHLLDEESKKDHDIDYGLSPEPSEVFKTIGIGLAIAIVINILLFAFCKWISGD